MDLNDKLRNGTIKPGQELESTPLNAAARDVDAQKQQLASILRLTDRSPQPERDYSDDDAPDAPPKQSAPVSIATAGPPEIFAPLAPIEYLLAPLDMCPGAPVLVAGYGFSGKTLALQSMGISIAGGVRVWGAYDALQGSVLHIDYEQGSRLTFERYQRLGYDLNLGPSDLGDRLRVATMPPLYLDQPAGIEALRRSAEGCRMVIIDSLRACCPSVDENSSEVRRVLDELGRISEATGATMVVIHHARKPQKDSAGGAKASIRGSGAIFDACGSVVVFEGAKGEPVKVSHEKARTSGVLKDDFELVIEDIADGYDPRRGLRVSAQALSSSSVSTSELLSTVCAEVLDAIEGAPGMSGREIRFRVARSPNLVTAAIDALERENQINNVGTKSRPKWSAKEPRP